MGHDTHFLSRLDRAESRHVELALSLYRDDALIRFILEHARIPERAERAAICLQDPDGPFIVVTRKGRFVTCLGQGMSTGPWPIITRGQLDAIGEKVASLRERIALAHALTKGRGAGELLDRVVTAGQRLSREEFLALTALCPLMAKTFFSATFSFAERLLQMRTALRRVDHPKPRDEEALFRYWNLYWAMGHTYMLVGSEGREVLTGYPADVRERIGTLAWAGVRQGALAGALRALWCVGRFGKAILPDVRREFAGVGSELTLLTSGLSLAVIGLRHSKLFAEVDKALVYRPDTFDPAVRHFFDKYNDVMLQHIRFTLTEPDAAIEEYRRIGRGVLGKSQGVVGADGEPDLADESETGIAETLMANHLASYLNGDQMAQGLFTLTMATAWAARAKAEDFYFPKEQLGLLPAWRPELTMTLLTRLREHTPPLLPKRAEQRPGPNDPCSCGSSKKYKKCCGSVCKVSEG